MTSSQAKSPRLSPRLRRPTTRAPSWTLGFLTAVFFSLAALSPSIAQTTALGPRFVLPYQTVVDSTGTPVPGALLYFYASGTNTPLTTYSDALLTVPNPNPVKANAAGVFPNIFMVGNYKVVLTDSLGNQLWTADPVSGANYFPNPVFIGGYAMTFPGVAATIVSQAGLNTALPSTSALYKGTGGAGVAQPATVGTDYAAPGTAQNWSAAQTFTEVLGTVTAQSGTTYTFAATDCGTEVDFTNGSAITATIPATLPAGCNISVLQVGAGKVSVNGSAVTPATLHSAHSYTGTSAQWAIVGINIYANSGGSSAIAILTGDGS